LSTVNGSADFYVRGYVAGFFALAVKELSSFRITLSSDERTGFSTPTVSRSSSEVDRSRPDAVG
jgi:hypothetical protein